MKIVDLKQGSKEWLQFRQEKITATDASIINGTNTFRGNSPINLWREKLLLIDKEPVTKIMSEGTALEEKALEWVNKTLNTNFRPIVVISEEHDYLMASLDGYEESQPYHLEIKCGKRSYEEAKNVIIPPYYYDQVQHQMFITQKYSTLYVAYRPRLEPVMIIIGRDDNYYDKVLRKLKKFYKYLINWDAPE